MFKIISPFLDFMNKLSLKERQINARGQNVQNLIPQGKIMENQKINSEGQLKVQAKQIVPTSVLDFSSSKKVN